jgi:predicted phage terminase large subunit-like protein
MTRLAPVHGVFIVANRWHEDDLVGRIKRKNDPNSDYYDPEFPMFEILTFPAQNDDGTFLFEERFSPSWYKAERAFMGTYAWNAQALQEPRPRKGNLLRVDKVKEVDPLTWPKGLRWVWGWDLASTEKQRASADPDSTSGTMVSYDGKKLRIQRVVRGQWSVLQRRNKMRAVTHQHATLYVEAVAGYKDAVPLIREWLAGVTEDVREVSATHDLVARCSCVEPIFEAGNVEVPKGAEWLPSWREQFSAFPSGKHDDDVASLVTAAENLIVSRDGWGFGV